MITTLLAALAATMPMQDATASAPAAEPDYRDAAAWLCRPDRDDACDQDLTATVIAADGSRQLEPFVPATDPAFDCFYVYPTVSLDPGGNSDMVPGDEERRVIQAQAARFGAECRVFAPIYRQRTLTALRANQLAERIPADRAMAYRDVAAAWDDYLANDNHGRGVVLIGHSQGALVLTELIARAIDGTPVRDRIVSAMLIGSNVPVPEGRDVGGVFRTMPLCRAADQFGCIVTYVSFRASAPPPAGSRFGVGDRPGVVAGCTNPAALGGGSAPADAYLPTRATFLEDDATAWTRDGAPVDTPFVKLPGLVSLECVSAPPHQYLAVTLHGDPADPRTDDIPGDVKLGDMVIASWGLHLIDMNVAMGDLVGLAARQAAAWAAAHAGAPGAGDPPARAD